jgi:Na+-transporting methylmalonyl-CoA/oxaloacetate decarboxylase gamma subunit
MNVLLLVVTAVSVIAAVVSTTVAWRVTRDERRRSDARVAALSQAIYDDGAALASASTALFEDAPSAPTDSYRVVAAIAACVIVLVTGMTFVTARSTKRPAAAPAATADAPLELLALEHDRDGDRLIVRGLIRNPVNGAERRGLSAVVLLYRQDGSFLASGRAPVPLAALAGGETTPFVVSLPGANDVERFRLSFRTGARVEPHVDRRGHQAQEGATP